MTTKTTKDEIFRLHIDESGQTQQLEINMTEKTQKACTEAMKAFAALSPEEKDKRLKETVEYLLSVDVCDFDPFKEFPI